MPHTLTLGKRHLLGTAKIAVLETTSSAVKLGIAMPEIPRRSVLERCCKYYVFSQGERWLVCWRSLGETLVVGRDLLQISDISTVGVVVEHTPCRETLKAS